MGILLEVIDGGKHPEEAQGCHMMVKNEVSHDWNAPGPRIGRGYHPINLRGPVPKRDGLWECSGRVKPPLGMEEKGKRFCPILGVFFLLYWEKLRKGITKVITTTGPSILLAKWNHSYNRKNKVHLIHNKLALSHVSTHIQCITQVFPEKLVHWRI